MPDALSQTNGVLVLDKPLGWSSRQALQQAKRFFGARKAGHAGTLDPLATGVLPICFGEATKFVQFISDADKTYLASLKLGITTTTGDKEGEVLATRTVDVGQADFLRVIQKFVGTIMQVPPMYSALKHQGKALYLYAREGVEIARSARPVTVYAITLNTWETDLATITVRCSKGTYIRTLAEDIGLHLGCGAHLVSLCRVSSAHYNLADAVTLDDLRSLSPTSRVSRLLPVDSALQHLPALSLTTTASALIKQGQAVQVAHAPQGLLRLYNAQQIFIGLGFAHDQLVHARRLLAT